MARLIYIANASLDGYTEDRDGKFDGPTQTRKDSGLLPTLCVRPALISMDVECIRP